MYVVNQSGFVAQFSTNGFLVDVSIPTHSPYKWQNRENQAVKKMKYMAGNNFIPKLIQYIDFFL